MTAAVSAKCTASAPLSVGTRAARHQNESRRTNAQFVSAQETISIHVQALERRFLRRRESMQPPGGTADAKTMARATAAVQALASVRARRSCEACADGGKT